MEQKQMNRCPISYQPCGKNKYSRAGLDILSRKLKELKDIAYTAKEQREEAGIRIQKLSIQGMQAKLSAKLNIKDSIFELVDVFGKYILKPQHKDYKELPENEDLTMRLASLIGLDIPVHGMAYSKDGSLTYFIKRFDRKGHKDRVHVEDFSQLAGRSRETKYDYSMEQLVKIIEKFCSFPELEKVKLLKVILFNFLIGNEDMHLKNYSLIVQGKKTELSPFYDLLNTTIVMSNVKEEIALPIMGKKNKLNKDLLLKYFASQILGIKDKIIQKVLEDIYLNLPRFKEEISISFLSKSNKKKYLTLLEERALRLF
jgi:serine/threonine-protein kinase HipA